MIRRATAADIAAIAALQVRSFRAAYRGLLLDAYLDALDFEQRAATWQRVAVGGKAELAVKDIDGTIAGFMCLGPSRDTDAAPHTGEVMALHVDPGSWRSGVGRELMDLAKLTARERGWPLLTLWVLRDNVRARRFYEAVGFHTDGVTHERSFDGMAIPEVRYARMCER